MHTTTQSTHPDGDCSVAGSPPLVTWLGACRLSHWQIHFPMHPSCTPLRPLQILPLLVYSCSSPHCTALSMHPRCNPPALVQIHHSRYCPYQHLSSSSSASSTGQSHKANKQSMYGRCCYFSLIHTASDKEMPHTCASRTLPLPYPASIS